MALLEIKLILMIIQSYFAKFVSNNPIDLRIIKDQMMQLCKNKQQPFIDFITQIHIYFDEWWQYCISKYISNSRAY